jgi:hypothetical protein
VGQPERDLGVTLNPLFQAQRESRNSAVIQEIANVRVGDNSAVEMFSPASPLKIHSVIPLLCRERDVVRFRHDPLDFRPRMELRNVRLRRFPAYSNRTNYLGKKIVQLVIRDENCALSCQPPFLDRVILPALFDRHVIDTR